MQKQMLGALFQLFEWAFQVKFGKEDRQAFSDELLREWNDDDVSEQYLVMELIQTRNALLMLPPAMQEAQRGQVVGTLSRLISEPRSDDCGRVLHLLGTTLQRLGATTAQVTAPNGRLSAAEEARMQAEYASVSRNYNAISQSAWSQNQSWVQSTAIDSLRAINGGSGASYPGQW